MGMSNYLENVILDHIFDTTTYSTSGNTFYLALHTQSPTDAGGAGEVTGGSYARQLITFGAASNGAVVSTNSQIFPAMPAVTVTHISVWDDGAAGNMLFWSALPASIAVSLNDAVEIDTGDVAVKVE